MKKQLIVSLLMLIPCLMPTICGLAASPFIRNKISYEYSVSNEQPKNFLVYKPIYSTQDLNKLVLQNDFDSSRTTDLPTSNYDGLEFKNETISFVIGQPNFTLGNGLIATISGRNSLKVSFHSNNISLSGFCSIDNPKVLAADFIYKLPGHNNLMAEYALISSNHRFAVITTSFDMCSDTTIRIETTRNLNTRERGYQVTTLFGKDQNPGDAVVSMSYRNIQPGAISEYCTNSNYDDSVGIRLETTYKITSTLTFTASQDFVHTQDNSNKDESFFTLSHVF